MCTARLLIVVAVYLSEAGRESLQAQSCVASTSGTFRHSFMHVHTAPMKVVLSSSSFDDAAQDDENEVLNHLSLTKNLVRLVSTFNLA